MLELQTSHGSQVYASLAVRLSFLALESSFVDSRGDLRWMREDCYWTWQAINQ